RGGLERAFLPEDRGVERLQRRTGLDPELLDENAPRVVVRVQRLALTAGAVEREHQQAARALAKRVLGDQGLELADRLVVPPERDVGVDPLLERSEAKILQPADLRLGERLVSEIGQRRPPPEP